MEETFRSVPAQGVSLSSVPEFHGIFSRGNYRPSQVDTMATFGCIFGESVRQYCQQLKSGLLVSYTGFFLRCSPTL